jgi:hypothetical protein
VASVNKGDFMHKAAFICLVAFVLALIGCSSDPARPSSSEATGSVQQPYSSTATIDYTGGTAQIPPGNICVICGGDFSGNSINTWAGGVRTFADPSPAGAPVTTLSVALYYGDCNTGNVTVTVNGTTIGSFNHTSGNCVCGSCAVPTPTVVSLTNAGGIPGYVKGGTNTLTLTSANSALYVHQAVITASGGDGSTTTSLTSSINPTVFGQATTFTATVSPVAPFTQTPTGNVTFFDGASTLATVALAGGVATLTTSSLAVGSHAVTATFNASTPYTASTSSVVTQVVNKAATTSTLASSPNPSAFGQSVTLTATVSASAPGTGTPGGSVTFFDGASSLGTVALAGGTASLSMSNLSTGAHSLTVAYGGSASFNASTSSVLTQNVNAAATATTLASGTNPSVAGQAVTFVSTVSVVAPGAGSPSGTVTFFDGASSIGTGAISGGIATFATSSLGVGSHTITATYNGNASFAASTSSPITQTVNLASSATSVVSSTNPTRYGQSTTFTATVAAVAPASGTPGGTVTFFDGAASIGSATLSGGLATLAVTTLDAGAHAITASYGGDSAFDGSTSSVLTQTVNPAQTSTAIASSVNPSAFGQAVTFTASVTALLPGGGTPTGSVTFLDGAGSIGSAALVNGVAILTTSSLAVGAHSISAAYGATQNFNGSTSSSLNQTVTQANSAVSVASSTNPSVIGQAVTFTATVAAVAPGGGTPGGSVTFSDGATSLGTVALSGGVATVTTSALSVGTHAITATYGGSAQYVGSSGGISQLVNKASTAVAIASSVNPSAFGQSVTFSAAVTVVAPGAALPTGTVTFLDGAGTLGTGTLDASGNATFATSALAVGAHAITARYEGDAKLDGSTSAPLTETVSAAATSVALASSVNPSTFGQSVSLTATVTVTGAGSGAPSGNVTFRDGTTVIGTASLGVSGVATLATSALPVGARTITATYNGDASFAASTSSALTQTVNQASTTTAVGSSSAPSIFGQSVTFTATVAAVAPGAGTPTGTVTFFDGATQLGTGTLDASGNATFAIASLAVGDHTITAKYGGSGDFAASTSSAFTQTVNQGGAVATITSSANPSVYGDTVTFQASVTGAANAATPTGSVTFKDGTATLGTVALDANGTATLTPSALTGGSHTIVASYGGDASYQPASASLAQVVNPAATSGVLTASAASIAFGAAVTLTMTVTSPVAGTITGTVTFKDGTTTLGTASVGANGVATFSATGLTAGSHALTASYGGDTNYAPSTSASTSVDVTASTSTTALVSSKNPSSLGDAVTFTATVTSPALGVATGSVAFNDGTTSLGNVTLDTNGAANLTTSALTVGTHAITAAYGGDSNYAASTSTTLSQVVLAPGVDGGAGDGGSGDGGTDGSIATDGGADSGKTDGGGADGAVNDGSAGGDASLDGGATSEPISDSGCGCRLTRPRDGLGGSILTGICLALLALRRRRARARARARA